MSNEFVSLQYEIASGDFIKGGEGSSNVKKALMQLGIRNDIIKRVCIACYESEMNIVIHSLGGKLKVNIFEDKVEIIAQDYGPGIENIDLAMTEGYSTASATARQMGFGAGMGLPNMKKSSDAFDITSVPGEYTKIIMVINFS
jgi:anti-sigma regulatory factor (Ser/Thr protein kinase)